MQFNAILFPAPESCYLYRKAENIVYIPKKSGQKPSKKEVSSADQKDKENNEETKKEHNTDKVLSYIPCLYLPHPAGCDKILVFFHGNAEDIGWTHDFANSIRKYLRVHVLSVEYPGYGLYIGSPNADKICKDAEIVYDFLVSEVGILEENILLFGRSIGSGPATHLAARRNPSALVLMSPYTSVCALVKNAMGSFAKIFVAERFKNIDEIKYIRCPVLFIHGIKDTVVPKEHSTELLKACSHTVSHIAFSETMTHDEFDIEDDVIYPLKKFLVNCAIKVSNKKQFYEFPAEMYEYPNCWNNKQNKRPFMSKFYEKLFE